MTTCIPSTCPGLPAMSHPRGKYTTKTRERLIGIHHPAACEGRPCCIHAPSDHPLAKAPDRWDDRRRCLMRQCEHGTWHVDADHVGFVRLTLGAEHADLSKRHECPCNCCGLNVSEA